MTEILVTFSGAVNVNEAQGLGEYSLVMAGNHGSFTARNAKKIKLRTASYNAATDTVTLIPRKAFARPRRCSSRSTACRHRACRTAWAG